MWCAPQGPDGTCLIDEPAFGLEPVDGLPPSAGPYASVGFEQASTGPAIPPRRSPASRQNDARKTVLQRSKLGRAAWRAASCRASQRSGRSHRSAAARRPGAGIGLAASESALSARRGQTARNPSPRPRQMRVSRQRIATDCGTSGVRDPIAKSARSRARGHCLNRIDGANRDRVLNTDRNRLLALARKRRARRIIRLRGGSDGLLDQTRTGSEGRINPAA